jgi:hypothetical protein
MLIRFDIYDCYDWREILLCMAEQIKEIMGKDNGKTRE